jgi:hypothetical protein
MDIKNFLGMDITDVRKSSFVQSLALPVSAELIGSTFYRKIHEAGILFIASFEGSIASIQFFSAGHQDYRAFTGELPEGLDFSRTRPEVVSKLGPPGQSGGGDFIRLLGKVPPWDRFLRDGYSVHVRYAEDEQSVSLVSLIRANAVPE